MTAPQTWPEPRPIRLTVDDYLLIDGSGALAAHGKTELIDGVIVAVSLEHRRHGRIKTELGFRMMSALRESGSSLAVLIECSVAMPPSYAPLPDIVVTSEPEGEGLIPLASARLLVEVSDSTPAYDRRRKAAMYAANAVPEYWVVDVRAEEVHQYWSPADGAYAERRPVEFGDRMDAVTIPMLVVETAGL